MDAKCEVWDPESPPQDPRFGQVVGMILSLARSHDRAPWETILGSVEAEAGSHYAYPA